MRSKVPLMQVDPAKLRAARDKRGYEQTYVADELQAAGYGNLSRQSVWGYEAGKAVPPPAILLALAMLYRTSMTKFFTEVESLTQFSTRG